MGVASSSPSHALQNCLRPPQACPPDRVARLCAALRDVGMPPAGVQVSAHGDLILFEPIHIPHIATSISTTTPTPGTVVGAQAVRPPGQQPGQQPGRQLGASTAAVTAPESACEVAAAAPGAATHGLVRARTASGALEQPRPPSLPPSVDGGGITFK